jgi:hypothetical protein
MVVLRNGLTAFSTGIQARKPCCDYMFEISAGFFARVWQAGNAAGLHAGLKQFLSPRIILAMASAYVMHDCCNTTALIVRTLRVDNVA